MEYHGIQNLRSIASLCVWSSARCRQPELNAPNGSALKPQQIMAGCHGSVGVLAMAVSAMDSFDVLRFTAMGVRLGGLWDVLQTRNKKWKNNAQMDNGWQWNLYIMVHCLRVSMHWRWSPNAPYKWCCKFLCILLSCGSCPYSTIFIHLVGFGHRWQMQSHNQTGFRISRSLAATFCRRLSAPLPSCILSCRLAHQSLCFSCATSSALSHFRLADLAGLTLHVPRGLKMVEACELAMSGCICLAFWHEVSATV